MRPVGAWAVRLLAARPRQPDRRSCGASVLVVERALRDEGYARVLADGPPAAMFRREVLAMHRRITSPVTVTGRLQLPWPRALGTPPWAVAGQLRRPGRHYVVRWAWRRTALLARVTAAVRAGNPVPLYVGSRWLPRHVVLVVGVEDDRLSCYEPSSGRLQSATRQQFLDATLTMAGWTRPWCAAVPRREVRVWPARRTRA
jgi:hypothetical protein